MRAFVKTDDFKKLDIGFALDEACGNPNGSDYIVFNAEKYGMKFTVHCPGPSGHGSSIQISNTAGEKVQRILNRVYEFREQQKNKVKTFFELGTITTINLTMMKGGLQNNVLPTNLELVFDARVSPTVSEDEWESILNGWCKEAGDDVWIEYQIKDRCIAPTILDADNPYWMAFRQTLDNMDAKYNVLTLPACTDARFLREARVPTIGFSPNNNTPIKAHCSNEFLNVKTFLTGINVYTKIIQALCNCWHDLRRNTKEKVAKLRQLSPYVSADLTPIQEKVRILIEDNEPLLSCRGTEEEVFKEEDVDLGKSIPSEVWKHKETETLSTKSVTAIRQKPFRRRLRNFAERKLYIKKSYYDHKLALLEQHIQAINRQTDAINKQTVVHERLMSLLNFNLEKQIEKTTDLVHTSSEQLNYMYEIDRCLEWIQKHNFTKVCLQFPDYLLPDSSEVATCLQLKLNQPVYIMADTSYESCCVDYIAAAHVQADAIIHFGPVCFSKPSELIPCLYIYEKHVLDIDKLRETLQPEVLKQKNVNIILDTPYIIHANLIQDALKKVTVRPITEDCSCAGFVIIIGNNLRKILNYKLSYKLNEVFYYNPITNMLTHYEQDTVVLKRRYFLIEKIKDSSTFGIIIGTVAVRNYLNVIERMKKLIRAHGKKYYVISVGKPTIAKLANFAEIEMYIVISCSMNEIYDSREFYKPIVTPYDMEVALNPHWTESQFSYDYNTYLSDSEITKEDVQGLQTDVSLITGKLRGINVVEENEEIKNSFEIVTKTDGTVAVNSNFGAGFLSQRSWKGLEQNLGFDKPNVVTEGRTGVAQSYKSEPL
ncbi:hypothetical protein FQA39_LY17718 [Lamprigera yunnana]|nr:hypothetical protein FQA39_LY17718 [Lamprigera yunnana]